MLKAPRFHNFSLGSLHRPFILPLLKNPSTFWRSQYRPLHTEKDISEAKKWLESYQPSDIPATLFEISYSRASGAGGQKVNKTSSKATVSLSPDRWLNPQFCYWIPSAIRSQLVDNKLRYETKSGGLLIQSDATRNRLSLIHI